MTTEDAPPPDAPDGDPVWTFRGYQMRPAEFNTAMVHYYRAEIQRSSILAHGGNFSGTTLKLHPVTQVGKTD